ncbi:MAG: MarR family transcriptional regulator [Opitutaceae bacterium]|nr:MarR family transcriptional regulator [Opitutaceae bacterium]
MKLTPAQSKLVLHWGEMGTRWGINRTVAQIHALLYFSPKPLAADEITEVLQVARSHVSNSLKELQAWGIVGVVHLMGDRRDHFQSLKDVWQTFEILLDERKRREVDPMLKVLRETSAMMAEEKSPTDAYTQERVGDLLTFLESVDSWYGEVRRLPRAARMKLVTFGAKLSQWLR